MPSHVEGNEASECPFQLMYYTMAGARHAIFAVNSCFYTADSPQMRKGLALDSRLRLLISEAFQAKPTDKFLPVAPRWVGRDREHKATQGKWTLICREIMIKIR